VCAGVDAQLRSNIYSMNHLALLIQEFPQASEERNYNAVNVTASINSLIQGIPACFDK